MAVAGGELSPPDAELLVQQGGTLVFKGRDVCFRHDDLGILKYTDADAFLAAVDALPGRPVATQSTIGRQS
jgi:hypothetical protein